MKLALGPTDRSDHPAISQAYEMLGEAFEQVGVELRCSACAKKDGAD